jgi:hypothetical protein
MFHFGVTYFASVDDDIVFYVIIVLDLTQLGFISLNKTTHGRLHQPQLKY